MYIIRIPPPQENPPISARTLLLATFALLLTALSGPASAEVGHHRGQIWLYWGYNWAVYSESDLHFQGPGYDFTLDDVTAHDRPTHFGAATYLNPGKMTLPQYELRAGYFIGDRTTISLGMSHLKYVMTQGQGSTITGTIDASASATFAGNYDHDLIQLDGDFLKFEHTDGLNYTAAEIETMLPAWESSKLTKGLYVTVAAGAGIVTPVSNVTLFGGERSDRLNLAGWGLNTKIGLKAEFLHRFFVRYFINVGWMDLSGIPTTNTGQDTAAQSLFFLEHAATAGATLYSF